MTKGTLAGSVIIINYTAAPKLRPVLIGTWMCVFMIATILGPLLGGVFTTEVTWRWCFWVNLPVGGLALVMQLVYLRMPKHVKPAPATLKEVLLHLDFPGFSLLLSSLVCYTLALQWGGLSKSWRYVRAIQYPFLPQVLTLHSKNYLLSLAMPLLGSSQRLRC